MWNTIKKWLEPSKNNIVILSNSKRTNKMKGLRVKKIYEDDVEYGSWKKNWKKRKEMIFEVVNTSGRKTRKKKRRKQRGGMDIVVGRIYERVLTQGVTFEKTYAKVVKEVESRGGYKWIVAKFGPETNDLNNKPAKNMNKDVFIRLYKPSEFAPNNKNQDGAGKRRRKKKTRKKRRRNKTRKKRGACLPCFRKRQTKKVYELPGIIVSSPKHEIPCDNPPLDVDGNPIDVIFGDYYGQSSPPPQTFIIQR